MEDSKHRLRAVALTVTRWVGSLPSVIIHTILFIASFAAVILGFISFDRMLLVLTTIVSLEAIYLSIFIQMTINFQQESLTEVVADIDEIQEDIDEIQEDVDEIQEDVEEITEDTAEDEVRDLAEAQTLTQIHDTLKKLMQDVEHLQHKG
jgi:low affinity Fe/Cu permease